MIYINKSSVKKNIVAILPEIIKKRIKKMMGVEKQSRFNNRQERPCHYRELFVNSKGEVYPCCRIWGRKDMMICHIDDLDIMEKILNFVPPKCACNRFSIRKIAPSDEFKYNMLNIEFSLACQAKCAMCCVKAPEWKGVYTCYEGIENLIKNLGNLDRIVSQGGEILIQKKTLSFIRHIRESYQPDTWFHLISNGNADIDLVKDVERDFNSITISMVGFQPETYKKIMSLDILKTKNFINKIIKSKKISVSLKYLATPLNFHEQNLFLEWALSIAPMQIQICKAGGFDKYINYETSDQFWKKIYARTAEDVKLALLSCDVSKLENTKITIQDCEQYGIDDDFIDKNGFRNIITEYDT